MPPAISNVPSDIIVEATGREGAVVAWPQPTAADLVDGPVAVVCTPASAHRVHTCGNRCHVFCRRLAWKRRFAAVHRDGTDTTPPALSALPSDIVIEATSSDGALVTWPAPTARDIVDGVIGVVCSLPSGARFPLGESVVTCSATDAHDNSAKATFRVTVRDTTPPVLDNVPSGIVAEATGRSGAVVTWPAPTANDGIDGSLNVACVPESATTFELDRSTEVVCSAADAHGNTARATFNVSIRDTTAPTVSNVPSDMIVEATSAEGAVVVWAAPAAVDFVDGVVAVGCAPPSNSRFLFSATDVTCSAVDAHGNGASKSFKVTVVDTTPPRLENVPSEDSSSRHQDPTEPSSRGRLPRRSTSLTESWRSRANRRLAPGFRST